MLNAPSRQTHLPASRELQVAGAYSRMCFSMYCVVAQLLEYLDRMGRPAGDVMRELLEHRRGALRRRKVMVSEASARGEVSSVPSPRNGR